MKGLYWCQSMIGIGHVVGAQQIAKALLTEHHIDLLVGGWDSPWTYPHPNFRVFSLPKIVYLERGGKMVDPSGNALSKETLIQRSEMIKKIVDENDYDFLITEGFPFRKIHFLKEIKFLIHCLKEKKNSIKLFTCLLQQLDPNSPWFDHAAQILLNVYDHLLIFRDETSTPDLRLNLINHKMSHVGFLTDPLFEPEKPRTREKRIIITTGGGAGGARLLAAVKEAAPHFPDYQFCIHLGPLTHPSQAEFLNQAKPNNLSIHPMVQNFEELISKAALVIALGGTTTYGICHTRTPALIYLANDYGFSQKENSEIFAKLGLIDIISDKELNLENLREKIQKSLHAHYPEVTLNFDGAWNALKIINSHF